jgi:mannose-6-phosphate isomerase-like protein (cupin superfamily)
MKPIGIDDLIERQREGDELFIEFLRRDSLSMEVYRLPAGSDDPQDPHTEDEVYYIVDGRAKIRIADDTYPVGEGDIVFVEQGVEHFFFDIAEELVTLIFFAPARGTQDES